MRKLSSALRETVEAGKSIPNVFGALMGEGAEVRMGELTLIASAPGVGKSLVAVTLAVKAGVPTLFFSADTSKDITGVRVGAMLTGQTIVQVDQAMRDETSRKWYVDLIDRHTSHIRWQFQRCPSIRDIEQDVAAFAVAWGDYPHLIVVDNLRNVYSDEDDNTAFKHNMEALTTLASETGSAVVLTCHLTGWYDDGDKRPPLSALEGKVSKMPSLILTLFRGKWGDIGACIVKNRMGKDSAIGELCVYFNTDLERVQIT